jgi:Iap family predicted aminopeptidase
LACGEVADPDPATPISIDQLLTHIGVLADDSLYGRPAGWTDERRAAEYVRDALSEAGLTPGVPEFLQTFWIGPQETAHASTSADPPFFQSGDPGREATDYSQNVVASLPGDGELSGEWVVVGAHYDHVGWMLAPDSSLHIYNGADDNASGTAVLLEVARYLRERFVAGAVPGPRRSLVFIGFGAEEIGLVGSRFFCGSGAVPLTDIAAMVNLDMVGRLQTSLQVRAAGSAPWWADHVRDANTDDLPIEVDQEPVRGGSDHVCFLSAGRPAVHLFTGLHAEYHTPADDPPLINRDGLLAIAELTARLVESLAVAPSLAFTR